MLAVLCRNNPRNMIPAALFLAYLNTSADALNFTSKIPPEIISVIDHNGIHGGAARPATTLSGSESAGIVAQT